MKWYENFLYLLNMYEEIYEWFEKFNDDFESVNNLDEVNRMNFDFDNLFVNEILRENIFKGLRKNCIIGFWGCW